MIVAAALAVAGCASAPRGEPECHPAPFMKIVPVAIELAPGETLPLRPARLTYSVNALPPHCTAKWSVRGEGVSISRHGQLAAASDVAVGTQFTVRAERDGMFVEQKGLIVDGAPNPLVGAWKQRESPGCDSFFGPVGELIFRRGGQYLLTVRPFESQVGSVGSYQYDRQTGRLVMHAGQGTVKVEGRSLVFTGGFSFTTALPGETCTAVFDPIPMPNL